MDRRVLPPELTDVVVAIEGIKDCPDEHGHRPKIWDEKDEKRYEKKR
jgi:hypothetical protein